MRGIVNDLKVVIVGDLLDGIYITMISVAMHRHDGRRLRCDGRFDLCRIEVERVWGDVNERRLDAIPQQRMRGYDE